MLCRFGGEIVLDMYTKNIFFTSVSYFSGTKQSANLNQSKDTFKSLLTEIKEDLNKGSEGFSKINFMTPSVNSFAISMAA